MIFTFYVLCSLYFVFRASYVSLFYDFWAGDSILNIIFRLHCVNFREIHFY